MWNKIYNFVLPKCLVAIDKAPILLEVYCIKWSFNILLDVFNI